VVQGCELRSPTLIQLTQQEALLPNELGQYKLIDFGMSTFYIDASTGKHVPRNTVPSSELTGSPLYVSLNTHQGIKPSRRDDCIQLGYVYLYMSLGGHLPWEGISMDEVSSSIVHPTNQERAQLKKNYVSQDPLWTSYMQRCMELKYDETPDYNF
jgi:serine/threonine protein kinase